MIGMIIASAGFWLFNVFAVFNVFAAYHLGWVAGFHKRGEIADKYR